MIVLLTLADEIIVAGLVLWLLWVLHVPLTWPVYVALSCVLVITMLFMHRLIIPAYRRRASTGREAMVGLRGQVVEELCPRGTVRVNGEYWKAESTDNTIGSGENIEITGSAGMVLKVKRLDSPGMKRYDSNISSNL